MRVFVQKQAFAGKRILCASHRLKLFALWVLPGLSGGVGSGGVLIVVMAPQVAVGLMVSMSGIGQAI